MAGADTGEVKAGDGSGAGCGLVGVGRPEVMQFAGALQGQRANKGI